MANICAEVDDSAFALAMLIITQVNSVSSVVCKSLDSWAKVLSFCINMIIISALIKLEIIYRLIIVNT